MPNSAPRSVPWPEFCGRVTIDQGAYADAPKFLHAFHPGDAQHHHGEDDRCEHHLDQADEDVAERLEIDAKLRVEKSEQAAGDDADQDLHVQFSKEAR